MKRKPPTKKRTCLRCGKPFPSHGPGNRICPRCAKINSAVHSCGSVCPDGHTFGDSDDEKTTDM